MKKASSETNSAASAMKLTTRHIALETGLRKKTTAAANTSVAQAKIQKRPGDMVYEEELFVIVPFVDEAGFETADFVELFLVVHHLGARRTGDRVVLLQIDRLLRADFLAEPAVN